MGFVTILPMAVVMVAGPQILSAIFLATSEDPRRSSAGFLSGVLLATTIGTTLAYLVARQVVGSGSPTSSDSGREVVSWAVIALLVVLTGVVFTRRGDAEPPKWMDRLQTASPRFAFTLGFLLFLLMPTDIVTELTVGASLARDGLSLWYAVPFILLTLLLAALPVLVVLLFGKRARNVLPQVRDWMNEHSWIVNELVIAFFLAITIAGLGDATATVSGGRREEAAIVQQSQAEHLFST